MAARWFRLEDRHVNENSEQPRLTIRTLVAYLTAEGAHQRFTILQNMKSQLGRRHFAPYYSDARRAIRAHHSGGSAALGRSIERLLRAKRDANRPTDIARIDNNLRVLTDYRGRFAEELLIHQGQLFEPIVLRGVRVSVEPTLSGTLAHKRRTINCNVIVGTQADAPNDAEVNYSLEILYQGSGLTHPTPTAGAQYWHPASGSAWYLDRSSKRRWRDIEEACAEIAVRWPSIRG